MFGVTNNGNGHNGALNGQSGNGHTPSRRIWAIAGGKGGTGKSVMAANLGLGIATLGYRVILVDGDLGGANLHTCLNIRRPAYSLSDFLSNKVPNLEDVLLDTPNKNLKLISGGGEMIGVANLPYQRKMKLLRHLGKLVADFILVDLGAGTAYNTLDFFTMSNQGVLVSNPEPNAKLDAYSFLKNVVYRKLLNLTKRNAAVKNIVETMSLPAQDRVFSVKKVLEAVRAEDATMADQMEKVLYDFRPMLVMNKIRRRSQVSEGQVIVQLAREYLTVAVHYAGHVEEDAKVQNAQERMMPFLMEYPKCQASKDVYRLLSNLGIQPNNGTDINSLRRFRKEMKAEASHWR